MGTSEDMGKKIFPWGWGHWLNFIVLLFKTRPFPGLGGGGGIYFNLCLSTFKMLDFVLCLD